MKVQITRFSSDDRFYSVDTGDTKHSAMKDSDLKQWLFDIGVGDSTVSAILDMSPNETMTLEVLEKAA